MLQHVLIIIWIIFRELVCSLLKSLTLKFVKNVKSQCGDVAAQYLVCVARTPNIVLPQSLLFSVEIKCQLDATEVFIADLIPCSACFRHNCAHHQELKSIIQRMLQHPANRTHSPQLHSRPAT